VVEVASCSPDETYTIGKQIAGHLGGGSVVALQGTLGSGKTCLAGGIAFGLGITEKLTSPTYTIINEYQIPSNLCSNNLLTAAESECTLYHIDVYRLNNDKDFNDLGGPEIINSNGISVIEWSDRISKSLPQNTIIVFLKITGLSSRYISIQGLDRL